MATIPGWFSRPAACASRLKRAITPTNSAPLSCDGRMVLIATVRSMTGSNPSYRMPIAPLPRVRRIWYLPSLFIAGGALLVFGVDVPHRRLHQALHHGVQPDAALRALRHAHHARRIGADFHLQLLVTLGHLLGGAGVHDLVAHADQPDAGRLARLHRAGDLARGVAAHAAAAE